MKTRLPMTLFAFSLLFPSGVAGQVLTISVENPASVDRPNEPVVLPWGRIAALRPDARPAALRVSDETGDVLPLQVDDLDLDGVPDEVLFLGSFAPRSARRFVLSFNGESLIRGRPDGLAVDAANWKRVDGRLQSVDDDHVAGEGRERRSYRYDGVGWESETVGYRLYLDERNAIDIQGKRHPALHWNFIGSSGVDYQLDAAWGMDVLHVGPALGIGGIGFWIGDSVLKPVVLDRQRTRILARGPVRAVVRVDYSGWNLGVEQVDVTSLFTIAAGDRTTEHRVILRGTSPRTIATGIVKHANAEVRWDAATGRLWTLGGQSRADDGLLLALQVDHDLVEKKVEDAYNHLVLLRAHPNRPLSILITTAWQGERGISWDREELDRQLIRTGLRLREPLRVRIE